jgi:hypothetical protein
VASDEDGLAPGGTFATTQAARTLAQPPVSSGRKAMRRTLATLVFALALSTIPQLALAADSYSSAVSGREILATSTLGVFAGIAAGPPAAIWTAAIYHTPLSTVSTITGGSFTLVWSAGGKSTRLNGTFSPGGSVTQVGGFSGCVTQTYLVVGTLANVGPGGGTGAGTFEAELTHHNTMFFGHCITYKATVIGRVSLSF